MADGMELVQSMADGYLAALFMQAPRWQARTCVCQKQRAEPTNLARLLFGPFCSL